jgi:hypothetical protein
MQHTELPYHEAAILTRLVGRDEPVLSSATAKGFLALGYGPTDKNRMHTLAAKARDGTLTADELAEVEAYSRISSLLGILKSKARRVLKHRASNGRVKTH